MKKENISENSIDVYKWIKIAQSSILIILGVLFVITALTHKDSQGSVDTMLSISLGVILTVHSLLDILSGYLLYRNPYNQDVITGTVLLSFAVVLFIKRDIINEVLSYFVACIAIIYAILLIIHGIDMCIGKGTKKSVSKAVLGFVLAFVLIASGIVYLIFYTTKKESVEIYMLMILGVVLVILGISTLSLILVKIRNTKKMLKQKQMEEEEQVKRSVNTDHPTNTDVKIIDISELRKKTKKANSQDKEETDETVASIEDNEVELIENSSSDDKKD